MQKRMFDRLKHINPAVRLNADQSVTWLLLLLVMITVTVIRLHFIDTPFERDEGSYCYLGKQVLEGKTPYVDFYERKFPVIFYSYALLIALFGYSLQGMHLAFITINLASVLMIYSGVRKLLNRFNGLLAATAFAFLSLSVKASGFTIQSEHLVIFYALAGGLFFIHALHRQRWVCYFFSGILLSLAILVKQNAVFWVFYCLIALAGYWLMHSKHWLLLIKSLLIWAAGLLFPVIIISGIMLIQGSFDEMIYWTVAAAGDYISGISISKGISNFIFMLKRISATHPLLWSFAALGIVMVWFLRIKIFYQILVVLFVLISIISIVPGFRFFGHYWLLIFPSLAVAAGVFFYVLMHFFPRASWLIISLFFMAIVFNILQHRDYYFTDDPNQPLRACYGSDLFPATRILSDSLKKQMNEEDRLMVLGSEPQIYFYTKKTAPTRFHFVKLLIKIEPEALRNKYRDTMLNRLYEHPPEYIIYMSNMMDKDYANDLKERLNPLLAKYKKFNAVRFINRQKTKYYFNEEALNKAAPGQNDIIVFKLKE